MRNRLSALIVLLFYSCILLNAQNNKVFELKSPDNNIVLHVESGSKLYWSVLHSGEQILLPSPASLQLDNGEVLGENMKISSSGTEQISQVIAAVNYKKATIGDQYNQLTLNCKKDFGIVFRVYNDGVAYRFFTKRKEEIRVRNEEVNFNFTSDFSAYIPYMKDCHDGKIFNCSFESLYKESNISKFAIDSLAFLPVLVDVGGNRKVVILEADLEDYPGMYLDINKTGKGFKGVHAPYPLETKMGGWWNMNPIPTKRADYIAKTSGSRNFPWRAVVISVQDKELLNNDMVQKLASPSRIADVSWIKPGQAAWDWWSNWNITHVGFKAGINTKTYKYYIDFAAANKLKYIVMDEGWSERNNLRNISTDLNLKEIVAYGKSKDIGVILWATWYNITQQIDQVFPLYSKMGIKGFKIDFIDRDDQLAVASTYEIAKKASEYHLLVDYHGVFKPTGLQRTYPNVIGYEGVKGLENYKWANEDAIRYALTIPFIRMVAGPMDYTPGAMRNSNRENYRVINNAPMSKGTRCNQMAMYVVFEAPLQMLADNPAIYTKEQECTDFIASVPTTFDQTVALNGKVGEYAAIARKKGETWFVGALNDWTPRELMLDFSFLEEGHFQAIIFKDGMNADRDATDYTREVIKISKGDKLTIQLAPGGGWSARIERISQ
jgi:alpha-glucosidase